MTYYTYFDTPAGTLLLVGNGTVVQGMHWKVFKRAPAVRPDWIEKPEVFANVITQLNEYFAGKRKVFNLPLNQDGTDFQMKIWELLCRIPYGKTISYNTLAKQYGDTKAVRAVASANGRNNIAIIVPCHRVIGSDHSLVGYGGGLWRKKWLLEHEAKYHHGVQQIFPLTPLSPEGDNGDQ